MRNYVLRAVAFALVIAHCAEGLQRSAAAGMAAVNESLTVRYLDEKEVEQRGSRCLDGSAPIFHHKVGSESHKFIIWLNPGYFCTTLADCYDRLPVKRNKRAYDALPVQLYGEFNDYHHVILDNCDLGLYIGNVDEPAEYKGQKLYFQGSRIVKHVIDVLHAEYGMEDVLVTGGSGGAQSSLVGADYMKSIMPTSVKRFGIVPFNGYSPGGAEHEVEDAYSLHGMGDHVSAACVQASTKPYVCIKPSEALKYSSANIFIVQMFDFTFSAFDRTDLQNAWMDCLGADGAPTQGCHDKDTQTLSEYFEQFVTSVTKGDSAKRKGVGGFLATCPRHNFYKHDDYCAAYSIEGVTVLAAVEKWWQGLAQGSSPQWHLPCALGKTKDQFQCNPACNIVTKRYRERSSSSRSSYRGSHRGW